MHHLNKYFVRLRFIPVHSIAGLNRRMNTTIYNMRFLLFIPFPFYNYNQKSCFFVTPYFPKGRPIHLALSDIYILLKFDVYSYYSRGVFTALRYFSEEVADGHEFLCSHFFEAGPVGFEPTACWLRASHSDHTELRAHASIFTLPSTSRTSPLPCRVRCREAVSRRIPALSACSRLSGA